MSKSKSNIQILGSISPYSYKPNPELVNKALGTTEEMKKQDDSWNPDLPKIEMKKHDITTNRS